VGKINSFASLHPYLSPEVPKKGKLYPKMDKALITTHQNNFSSEISGFDLTGHFYLNIL
jgi:hypothetical protein